MKRILIHATSEDAVNPINSTLMDGYSLECCHKSSDALSLYLSGAFDFAFFEFALISPMPELAYLEAGGSHADNKLTPIIMVCRPNETEAVIKLMNGGVSAYLVYPLMPSEITLTLEQVKCNARMDVELQLLREQALNPKNETLCHSENSAMQAILKQIETAAPTSATILLNGETRAGKRLLAKDLHEKSRRGKGPFISVNCGAIPDSLVESELFGHEKGAFTGAIRSKMGQFEIANKGTIFLDEISTLPFHVQIKLLHVLQEKTIVRVGGESPVSVDVRVIAATNDDLEDMCSLNQFRKDLYYRLNVFPVDIPPLRKREEDIPALSFHFIQLFNTTHNKKIEGITRDALNTLCAYEWPGNIRELQNILERAYILTEEKEISLGNLPAEICSSKIHAQAETVSTALPISEARRNVVDMFERRYLVQLLTENRGGIKYSAIQAGVTTRQLQKLMTKHHIKKEIFR